MVIVCGEALIDIIENADGTQRAVPGGGPFNTARALARLGVPTAFLGRLSQDRFGRELAGLLTTDGASLELATVGPEPTTTARAEIDSAGRAEYRFEIEGTSAPNLTPDALPEHLGSRVRALHVGTLGLVLESMASTLVDFVQREGSGRLVMLDPNIREGLAPEVEYRQRLRDVIACSAVVKASEEDLAWMYPGEGYEDAAELLLGAGVRLVAVTLGESGTFGAHRSHRIHVDAVPVEVVDTIGAGDAFGAALLAWLYDHGHVRPDLDMEPGDLRNALEYASLAAAITCSRAGADPPWKRELIAATRP